ncbi:MAG: xylulose kinase [Chloroflexi bacterium]|jgi:FGGY-family pentulose kinase|uniref:FGGY-family carbohydrate kinase n=1 Tax=Candidatus Roseilinea sp. NK_OTU-006 TaxID=2704250 RepID=UPI000F2CF02E|nr:FGGY family carbohydrate kinase [Candidatus Roseilinea sp. NK_OTU-006]RMG63472.1 MAG: xylulose kinase [Chloroflexota bacterium]
MFVLGVDFGTEGVRVGIFTPDGTPVAFAAEAYPTDYPRVGWAEQDPNQWWTAFVKATRRAISEGNVPAASIAAIGVDCTSCTVVVMDERFQPLRPAIIWMDVRAAAQADRIAASGHPMLKYNGFGNVSAEWMPCKMLWLKENEPEIYARSRHVGEFIDWVTYRLTGEWTASINNVSIRWYYDRNEGGWSPSFYQMIGLGDLIERFPSRVLDMGQVAGQLRSDVAEALGLPAGIPVAQGGADAFVAMFGLNVVSPGKMAFIVGSSHLMLGQSDRPFHAKGLFGTYTDAVLPGQYTVEGGQVSTGSVVRWFRDHFCAAEAELARQRGVSTYDVLNESAGQVPVGSEGLIVLDYFQGNRTPYVDSLARGVFLGLSLRHTTAHIFRAILEGIAYGSEHIFRTFRASGYVVNEIVAAGGPTKSRLWMQIHADVSGIPITLTRVPDATCLGSAVLAAVAGGLYPNVPAASGAMVHVRDRIEPDQERHEAYRFYADRYIETYPRLRDLIHAVVRHQTL